MIIISAHPPPAVMEVVLEIVTEYYHKRPDVAHVAVVPCLMTHLREKYLG